MTNDQQISTNAEPKDDKPLFIRGVVRIVDHKRLRILENSPCLLKSNGMLPLVDLGFMGISFKAQLFHTYIIIIQ